MKREILLQTSIGAVSDFVFRRLKKYSQMTQLKQLLLGSFGPALDEYTAVKRLFGSKQHQGDNIQILVNFL